MTMDLADMQQRLRDFAQERDWEQFHTPKNLVMALAGEVGELTELFQWLTAEDSADVMSDQRRAEQVSHELADVFGYVLRLADVLDIPLVQALEEKLHVNAQKYPVALSHGHATKYTELGTQG